jgi:hypothetical protein
MTERATLAYRPAVVGLARQKQKADETVAGIVR